MGNLKELLFSQIKKKIILTRHNQTFTSLKAAKIRIPKEELPEGVTREDLYELLSRHPLKKVCYVGSDGSIFVVCVHITHGNSKEGPQNHSTEWGTFELKKGVESHYPICPTIVRIRQADLNEVFRQFDWHLDSSAYSFGIAFFKRMSSLVSLKEIGKTQKDYMAGDKPIGHLNLLFVDRVDKTCCKITGPELESVRGDLLSLLHAESVVNSEVRMMDVLWPTWREGTTITITSEGVEKNPSSISSIIRLKFPYLSEDY